MKHKLSYLLQVQTVELQTSILEPQVLKLEALLVGRKKPEVDAKVALMHGKFTCVDKQIPLTTLPNYH